MESATIISLVVNAVFAIWVFYNSKYWPAQQAQREQDQAFNFKTRGEAFTQVLEINRSLVENLIARSKLEEQIIALQERITGIDAKLDTFRSDLMKVISSGVEDRERVDAVDAKIEKVGVAQ